MALTGRVALFIRFIAHLVDVIIILHKTSYAGHNKPHCPPSSCGNLNSISFPFRLKTDPQDCGDPRYEISCENNLPFLYLHTPYTNQNGYYKSYVQAINYDNSTIRVVDPDLRKDDYSIIPKFSITKDDIWFENIGFETTIKYNRVAHGCWSMDWSRYSDLIETALFLTCEKPINSNRSHLYNYIDIASFNNNNSAFSQSKRVYSYFVVNGNLSFSDLDDSCRIDTMTLIRKGQNLNTSSYRDIHNELVYGFELSWLLGFELEYTHLRTCVDEDLNKAQCLTHCVAGSTVNVRQFLEMLLPSRMVGTVLVIAFLIYKWQRRHLSAYDGIEEFLQSYSDLMPVRYSSWDIRKMSGGFKDKVGEGGFGSVYKGKLSDGHLVAIKVLGKSKANGQDFINEVSTIGRIHHVNVVQLIGFYVEGSKQALVYDFMPNGSLDKYIFPKPGMTNCLNCKVIFKISLGIAHGIEYLHRGCDMQILHFDIKPHNILLDVNFIPKISDFGLARLCPPEDSLLSLTAARGTFGYIAPELFYKNIGGVSYKADVYSYGMLLMEMANKRKNLNADAEKSSQIYFPLWIYDQFREGKDMEIEDATEEESKTVKKMIIVALWCIQLRPCDRPSMNKVIEMLEGEVESLQMPPKPYLYPQEQEHQKHNFEDHAGETSCSSTISEDHAGETSCSATISEDQCLV